MCFLKHYFFHLIFTQVWHLWQQKNNIAVGRRARVYTHAYALWASEACLFFICAVAGVLSVVASALLRVGWCRASIGYAGERNTCGVYCTKIQWYPGSVTWRCQKWWCLKLNCHFSAIFSLFGAISTHILIGVHHHSAILFHQLDLWVALDAWLYDQQLTQTETNLGFLSKGVYKRIL